jgi:outer membrane protein
MSAVLVAVLLAASPVSLEDARARSRENVRALAALLEAASAEQSVRSARAPLLPQVSFNTGANAAYLGEQRIFTTIPAPDGSGFVQQAITTPAAARVIFDFNLSVSQVLYDRARWAQLAQAGALAEAQQGQALEEADTSELEGIRRFFTLLRTQAALRVLEANARMSEQQLERARALFHAGRVGKSEEINAQVNLGNDRLNLAMRQGQLASDQVQLAVWMGLAGTDELEALDPGVLGQAPVDPPTLPEAMEKARANRPLLTVLRERLHAAEAAEQVAQSGFIPRLQLNGFYSRSGPSAEAVFTNPRLQNTVGGAVSLQWNIFDGLSTPAESERAAQQRRIADLNLQQTVRELEGEVRRTHQLLVAQLAATSLAANNRQSAAEGLRLAEERFTAGLGSTLEVRDAQLKLTQAELTLLENRVEVEVARFALMRAMGTLRPGDKS